MRAAALLDGVMSLHRGMMRRVGRGGGPFGETWMEPDGGEGNVRGEGTKRMGK